VNYPFTKPHLFRVLITMYFAHHDEIIHSSRTSTSCLFQFLRHWH